MLDGSYFTTESYPAQQRAGAWREALGKFSVRVKEERLERGFYGSLVSKTSPRGVLFGLMSSGAQELNFWDGQPNGDVCLALHLEGAGQVVDNGVAAPLAPGVLLFAPIGVSARILLQGAFRQLLIRMPHTVFASRLAAPLPPRLGRIHSTGGFGRIFTQMLEGVAAGIEDIQVDQLAPLELALAEFLVNCAGNEVGRTAIAGPTQTQNALLHRMSQMIEARLSDAELSVNAVAQDMGISVRYVHKLFESSGQNFSHFVRARRLERCRADLANPLYAHLSIAEICCRWVFNDAAHFSRAFRDEYGVAPRTFRRERLDARERSAAVLQDTGHVSRGWPDMSQEIYKKLVRDEAGILPVRPSAPPPDAASQVRHHHLPARADTVHWGHFNRQMPPLLQIQSGDVVTIETLSHHCSDDYERMVKGDSGAESVFRWTREGKAVERRGAGPMAANIFGRGAGEGFGVHICTGPVAVQDAQPGDVIEVRILDITPRPCANGDYPDTSFGSNAATWWGFHYRELLTEPKRREVVTVYQLHHGIPAAALGPYAKAVYSYRWTPQTDPNGVVHATVDYPGVVVDHATVQKNYDVLRNVRIPVAPHFGLLMLAPREHGLVDSIPPSYFGGNLDDRRAVKGARLYLPVNVAGGLFSVGDPHAAQGDGEVCGTAIECSLTGVFQLVLHKKGAMQGKPFADLNYPLLETADEWVVHGFSYSNYLSEFGDTAQSEIYKKSSLDPAMRDAFRKMRRFLMTSKGLTEDEAISLMSVAVDFGVTQVVNGNWCIHGILRKNLFLDDNETT